MPKPLNVLMHACRNVAIAAVLVGPATAADSPSEAPMSDSTASTGSDPYAWLEDVTGDKPLAWAKQQNTRTEAELAADPGFAQLKTRLLEVLDSKEKIPGVEKIGDWYYNFWKDRDNPKGLWRRSSYNGSTSNALVPDSLTDLGGGACFNDARVQVGLLGRH